MVGGIPVECLTAGELAGVWSGWSTMGDREVVRESSAKGTHLKLAHKFLACRKGWTIGEAQNYFYSEAEVWINELLMKHQIHRAGHILKNGKDPLSYICKICIESMEPDMRDYLANYVANNNGFTDAQIEAWEIVKCIKKYEEKYNLKNKSIENISIEKILNLSPSVKDPLVTEIYFHIYDSCLSNKLRNNIVWEYLLSVERIELLNDWIDQQYSDDKRDIIVDEYNLTKTFANLEITQEMIDEIYQSNASIPVKEVLLNHLCQYGVLNKKEQHDIKLTLSRFIGALITPSQFKLILLKPSCILNSDDFTEKIHSILYYQTVNTDEINHELYLKDKKLLDIFHSIHEVETIDQNVFNRAICQTIHHVSDNFDQFLNDNPLITLYLLLSECKNNFMKKEENNGITLLTLKDIIDNESGLIVNDYTINSKILGKLKNLPYLKDAIEEISQRKDINMYQFLHGYKNLNVHELFKWRQKNETVPNFANEHLIKKYGQNEKLTYKYYLKEARPSMAAYILQNSHSKIRNSLSAKMKAQIALYTHIFGLKHVNNREIISTCITFMEFLGINSECLRFHTTAVNYVQHELNISINDLLESIIYYQNPEDLATIMTHLEDSFYNEFPNASLNDVSNFVSALKSWYFIICFAIIHNTILPSKFLKYFATNNMWLEFVLTANIFKYPLEQVLDNVLQFKDKNIREHLLISLTNSQLLASNFLCNSNQKLSLREGKQFTLPKMKQKSNADSANAPPTCAREINEIGELITNPSDYFPLNQTTSPFNHDLWLIILKCHQSQDPPGALIKVSRQFKSSIFIVLAACYEPSSKPNFCYSWLVISTENDKLIEEYTDCLNEQVWSAKQVSNLFRKIISLGYVDTIRRGLEIFMPDNPLCEFFLSLVQYTKHHNLELCEKSLINFVNSCSILKSNKMIDWQDTDTTYLSNEYWIAIIAIECILTVLGTCLDSTHLQIKFLNILMEHDFNRILHIDNPNFVVLLKIIKSLAETNIKIDFAAVEFSAGECNIQKEYQKCIQKLIENKDFINALELSNITNLPCSKIILDQYRNEFARNIEKNREIDVSFWNKCALDIEKYNVGFEDAAEFFIEHAERVASYKERYEILQLALKALKPISTDQQTIDTVEMAMWKSCILAGPEAIEISSKRKMFKKLKTELLSVISNLRVSCILNDETEQEAVKTLIDRFIDDEDLETALRLSAIFNYKHHDLKILMLCLSVAEGEISPYKLNSQQKTLLLEPSNNKNQKYLTLENLGRRRHNSESSLNLINYSSPARNISTATTVTDNLTSTPAMQKIQMDCIDLLEKLINNLQHGINVAKKILLLYKISTYLKKSYSSLLISQNPMTVLYEITEINSPRVQNSTLINDAIAAYRIKNTEIVKFLVGEWILHITREVEDDILGDSVCTWGYSSNANLHEIADVSADAAMLGWELLKNANLRLGHSHGAKRDVSALKIVIELFILAHDYFTAACSMEGIASVLRKCQNLANTLQNSKLWSLLVRLVTGIGRFTEMNYIFEILKENDQFEFLLRKGLDKFSGLKIALLDFCKKQCPENKKLFTLVANHFQLYNEIAIMWESEAKTVIRELIKETRRENIKLSSLHCAIKFIKNDKTEKILQLAMDNFTHATEYYLKDNKLSLANRCACQAQLVALQLSLLNNATQNHEIISLLNLTTEELNKAMCQSLSFSQTLILIQAYNHNTDWSNVLYHHVILNGEIRFLKDFLTCKRLTPAIVKDCACRYRMEKLLTKQMTINMQSLISELNDIECKYVLASQLGFKNIIEVMISNSTTGAYLRDTIWKQGYHPQEFIGENFRS
ncbi:hypothetical protein PV327_006649 [Microctonus hyperodae]|uniref:Spatacsin C-terminal domain-containing protein n=1 Tax=Microctonus hyperodae TaxID=165561 RepID=A0AA39F4U0_MICHY|nr:hypothetical protein PV327_006649 [Microctonus hyperodae]